MENTIITNEIKQYLINKYECHLIILYGSYSRGDYTKESDVDLLCFSNRKYTGNDTSIQNGLQLDAWIYNTKTMKAPREYLHVTDGKIIHDQNNSGRNFLESIMQIYKKGPKLLNESEKQFLKSWLIKMLERSEKNDSEGNYRFHWMLKDSLEIYFNIKGLWFLGPKKSFKWLQTNDIRAYKLFTAAFNKNVRYPDVKLLLDYINEL